MSGAVGAIKSSLGASSSSSSSSSGTVGKAVAAAAAAATATASSAVTSLQNPVRCDRAATASTSVNYSRRNGLSAEDEWLFVGDISDEEVKHGVSFLREIIPGSKALMLETTAATATTVTVPPADDVQSISSEDTDSIEASRIIERTDEEIVYGRPKDRVTNSVTEDWNKLENVVFAAACDPNVQKAILENENVMNALRELKSGPLSLEEGDSSTLLPIIARAAEATIVTDTEEEKSFFEEVKDAIHKASHMIATGINKAKIFIQNLFGHEEKSPEADEKAKNKARDNKSPRDDGPSDNGFGKRVMFAVIFVLMVVMLRRGGFRMGPVGARA